MLNHGITTICLDEAHHLRREWYNALSALLDNLKGITVIALTATPPYDSAEAEWTRYINLCGEIDAEITVPELVADGTICPHQDYIYFNYPSHEEQALLDMWRMRLLDGLGEIFGGQLFSDILNCAGLIGGAPDRERLTRQNHQYAELVTVAEQMGYTVPRKVKRILGLSKQTSEAVDFLMLERVMRFVIEWPVFANVQYNVLGRLRKYALMNDGQVKFSPDRKTQRRLTPSRGKLESIANIVQQEYINLHDDLRLVILTDYIRRDYLHAINSEQQLEALGAVPIFEAVRRIAAPEMEFLLLSGSLVLCSQRVSLLVSNLAAAWSISCRSEPLGETGFSELIFPVNNQRKVALITEAFSRGYFHVLIGTAALLGEGWDSPIINSLILATIVGSFVQSNQLRGRAIRANHEKPGKTANIWHLATVEPRFKETSGHALYSALRYSPDHLCSKDYEFLCRRFSSFIAPAYTGETIESGIGRITDIHPPYDEVGIERINMRMLERSSDREAMAESWRKKLGNGNQTEVLELDTIHCNVCPIGFFWSNVLLISICSTVLFWVCNFAAASLSNPLPTS